MKKLLLALSLVGLLALPAAAQTNTAPKSTTVPIFLGQVYDTMIGQGMTNLDVALVETYTPSLKKWGSGLVVARNLPIGGGVSTGIGLGVDYYDKNFYALSGQISLKADLTPFSNWGSFGTNIIISPLTYVGIGTPFGGGTRDTGGGLETVLAAGGCLHLAHVLGGDLGLLALYGDRQGLGKASGQFYGGGLNMLWKF